MKKVFLLSIIAMACVLVSCEPANTQVDDPAGNNPDSTQTSFEELIIGRWECTKSEMKIWVSEQLLTDDVTELEKGDWEWEFDTNGFITMFVEGEADETNIAYRVDGDKLYFEPLAEYATDYYYIRKLTDTELYLEWITVEEKVNKYNEKHYFTRVK